MSLSITIESGRGHGFQPRRDYPAAIECFQASVDMNRTVAAKLQVIFAALLAQKKEAGYLKAAKSDYVDSLEITRVIGRPVAVASQVGEFAELMLVLEEWNRAEECAREALAMRKL